MYDGWDISTPDKISSLDTLIMRWTDWETDKIFSSDIKNIHPVIAPYNRFTVDTERLLNDPLENNGQGILYTKYENSHRIIDNNLRMQLMNIYWEHISSLKEKLTPDAFLIDCHSFPEDLSQDIDICIGYNNDWSKPENELIDLIKTHFESNDYTVGINIPYSNSLTPACDFNYTSLMIELNKRTYSAGITKIQKCIRELYEKLICI